jgi:hypothetical protein
VGIFRDLHIFGGLLGIYGRMSGTMWFGALCGFPFSREILALLDTLRLLFSPSEGVVGGVGFQVGTLYSLDFMSVTYHIWS